MTSPEPIPALTAAPPWLLLTGHDETAQDWREQVTTAGGRVVVMSGRRMRTEEDLHTAFAAAWDFPDYYGHNPSALEDCLIDLSWLDAAPSMLLVIDAAEEVLSAEAPLVVGMYANLLSRVCATWGEPVEQGEWWDRAAVPMHVLLVTSSVCAAAGLERRWTAAEADLTQL